MYPLYEYDSTAAPICQMEELTKKLKPKREWAIKAAPWLAKHVSEAALARYEHCGDYMTMLADETLQKRKIETAFFCGQRLCPGCAWRTSVAAAQCVTAISQAMADEKKIMLMITLTIRNVEAAQLREACLDLNRAWDKLSRRAAYRRAWADNIRKLEITYNAQRDDYHPHLHVIVYVPSTYFAAKKGKSSYISQAQLLKDWQKATGDPQITQVDVRRCRDRGTKGSAILEVSKYAAKAADFVHSERVYDAFYAALWHMRTMTYAGRAHELKAAYDIGKLDHYLPTDSTKYVYRLIYQYFTDQGYIHVETEPYTPPEAPTRAERVEAAHALDTLAMLQDLQKAREGCALYRWREYEGEIPPDWEKPSQPEKEAAPDTGIQLAITLTEVT